MKIYSPGGTKGNLGNFILRRGVTRVLIKGTNSTFARTRLLSVIKKTIEVQFLLNTTQLIKDNIIQLHRLKYMYEFAIHQRSLIQQRLKISAQGLH